MVVFPAERLVEAQAATAAAGLDALLIAPGADLRYLTGYDAHQLERLTLLVVPADGEPTLIVPRLERPAVPDWLASPPQTPLRRAPAVPDWLASPPQTPHRRAPAEAASGTSVRIVDHADGTDPYPLVRAALQDVGEHRAVAVSDRMWAEHVLALRAALPGVDQRLASEVLAKLRIRKSTAEVDALRRAGAAIDAVHAAMGQWLRAGRTEAEVAADIAAAIVAAGHARADFTIVASGPNGASPHHGVSDRVIGPGEPVVVDIGGTMPDGYCSDSTRVYVIGEPPEDFAEAYAALQTAQRAAVAAVKPGVTAASVDAAARDVLTDAGFGAQFLHRTGHGIGLDGHEEPYIVAGNDLRLAPGMTFSIEPGVYLAGRHGARIEDIVVCTVDGVERLNTLPTELVVL